MWDVAYLLITLFFFAAMLWYVRFCDRLGRATATNEATDSRGQSRMPAERGRELE